MATRATYRFVDTRKDVSYNNIEIYIHYDGYPSGAVNYFIKGLSSENTNRNLPEEFITINKNAQFTVDCYKHGDTEYHYDIFQISKSEYTIAARFRNIKTNKFETFFNGKLTDFIKKYKED